MLTAKLPYGLNKSIAPSERILLSGGAHERQCAASAAELSFSATDTVCRHVTQACTSITRFPKMARILAIGRAVVVSLVGVAIVWHNGDARASDQSLNADVRCVVVALHLLSSQTPQQREIGMMAAMYYFGRLDGQSPHADIEHLIESAAAQMTNADLKSDAIRCGKSLQTKGQEITKIGVDMSHK